MTNIRKRTWTTPSGEQKTAWLVDYRDGAAKRRFKQFARKKDADAWITQAAWEVSKGVHTPDSQSVTVADACDLWITRAGARGLERGTLVQYRQLSDLHIKPLIGGQKLSRLTAAHVVSFRDKLLEKRSKVMARKAVRALSSVLTDAMEQSLVAQNVAAGVKIARTTRERGKVEIPTKDELKALLGHSGYDFRPFVMTAILTGLRASELRGLAWGNVDLKGASIKVTQRADKFNKIGPPKSKAGYRSIPINAALVAELRAWKLRCPKGELGLVFPNSQGNVQDYSHLLRRRFFPLQIRAGVCDPSGRQDKDGNPIMKARYGLHALRHAAASAWIKQRIDLKRLQVWIGHENIQLTLDTYGHLIDDAEEDAKLIAASHADLFS